MKDRILKLCRRMRNATKADLLQIAEVDRWNEVLYKSSYRRSLKSSGILKD